MAVIFIYMGDSHFVLPNTHFERLTQVNRSLKNRHRQMVLDRFPLHAYCIHLQDPCHNQHCKPHPLMGLSHRSLLASP